MPLDTNIIMGYQAPQFESPVNQLAKVLQIQGAQQANQLNAQKMDEYSRGVAENNRLMQVTQGIPANATEDQRIKIYRDAGFHDRADKLETNYINRKKTESEVLGKDTESENKVIAVYRDLAGMAKDPATAAEYIKAMHSDPRLQNTPMARVPLELALSQIGQDPESFNAWKQQFGLGATEFIKTNKPTYQQQNLGGNMQTLALPGLGGAPTVVNSAPITQSANSKAEIAAREKQNALDRELTKRGQDLVDSRARETLASGKVPAGYRMKADGTMEAIPGGPADIKSNAEGAKKVSDAKEVLSILDQVDKLLPSSTGGYFGTGVDSVLGAANVTTKGAETVDKLKVLQGALVSKMPKMSGPQSDKDVLLYREMAGQVGDSTLPVARRQAAAAEVRRLNEKYAGMQEGESKPKSTGIAPKNAKGWALHTDAQGNKAYVSPDGKSFEEVR